MYKTYYTLYKSILFDLEDKCHLISNNYYNDQNLMITNIKDFIKNDEIER